jgi:hypothetical protein
MELVVLANSPFCKPDTGFMNDVLTAIENNIESRLLTLTVAAVSLVAAFALLRKLRAPKHGG